MTSRNTGHALRPEFNSFTPRYCAWQYGVTTVPGREKQMIGNIKYMGNSWHVCVKQGMWRPFRNCAGWKWDYRA